MKIRDEHKGTNFQHLELLGVTFHLGVKQTKSTALFWLFWLNDDGRRSVGKYRRLTPAFLLSEHRVALKLEKYCKINYICQSPHLCRGTDLDMSVKTVCFIAKQNNVLLLALQQCQLELNERIEWLSGILVVRCWKTSQFGTHQSPKTIT